VSVVVLVIAVVAIAVSVAEGRTLAAAWPALLGGMLLAWLHAGGAVGVVIGRGEFQSAIRYHAFPTPILFGAAFAGIVVGLILKRIEARS
jgi:hypothetical protein